VSDWAASLSSTTARPRNPISRDFAHDDLHLLTEDLSASHQKVSILNGWDNPGRTGDTGDCFSDLPQPLFPFFEEKEEKEEGDEPPRVMQAQTGKSIDRTARIDRSHLVGAPRGFGISKCSLCEHLLSSCQANLGRPLWGGKSWEDP